MKLSEIKPNPNNPRVIKDDKFKKLVKSIKEFPKMMALRPLVIDKDNMILGGNMRYRAFQELGYEEIPDNWVKKADELTEEEKKRFILADNLSFGEWNWDDLANEFETEDLIAWGFDKKELDLDEDEKYTKKITTPIYEPSDICPKINELYDDSKTKEIIERIDNSNITKEEKDFLKIASFRLSEITYSRVADYYAHSENKELKRLFEDLALVIIDFNDAIKKGYVRLYDEVIGDIEK